MFALTARAAVTGHEGLSSSCSKLLGLNEWFVAQPTVSFVELFLMALL
jgi:hypothetical protein